MSKTTTLAQLRTGLKWQEGLPTASCGLKRIRPEIASTEYDTYITLSLMLLYGLEATVLGKKEIERLEAHHRKNLRYIQHFS